MLLSELLLKVKPRDRIKRQIAEWDNKYLTVNTYYTYLYLSTHDAVMTTVIYIPTCQDLVATNWDFI